MRTSRCLAALMAAAFVFCSRAGSEPARAQDKPAVQLSGQVSSAKEGPMEGVLVTAKKDGSTISITVVSDKKGTYSFPAPRLEPGHYTLSIRAVGYDLDGAATADIAAGKTTKLDLKLREAEDLASQLTGSEWLYSATGTDQQKSDLLRCVNCHTVERIFRSTHSTAEFMQVLPRMAGYTNNSMSTTVVLHAQLRPGKAELTDVSLNNRTFKRIAEYLSTINLHGRSTWDFGLKTFPRPTGKATHVIITEYALPRLTMEPHDAYVDKNGTVWASNFGEQTLIKLDSKTGKVTEFPVPEVRKGFPTGMRSLDADSDGNLWIGNQYQGDLVRFDPKTEQFRLYNLPEAQQNGATQISAAGARQSKVDGKIWTQNNGIPAIHRVDINTGQFETFTPFAGDTNRSHNLYDVWPDAQNNAYFPDFSHESIGRIDAKTGQVTMWQAPTKGSRPRRGEVDPQGRVWYAGFGANLIGMFDSKTEKFQEWKAPSPWEGPYAAATDKNGDVWSGGQLSDRVMRLHPKTGEITEYLLPRQTDIRHATVDNSTTPPTFWVGNNRGAAIIKLEPLD